MDFSREVIMAKIIFGFSRPIEKKILSSAIMKVDDVDFSHAYIKLWSEKYNRYLIYQASGLQVNFVNQEIFESHNVAVHEFEVEVSDETRTIVMQYAIDRCGMPYSIKELFGFLLVKINSCFGKTIKNPFGDGNRSYVCSELVAEIIRECLGKQLPKDPDDMTPKDLCLFLRARLW
jgi:hypothetical protein